MHFSDCIDYFGQATQKTNQTHDTIELFEYLGIKTGFEYLAICHMSAGSLDRGVSGIKNRKTNFKKEWVDCYVQQEMHRHDPVIAFAPRTSRAIPWHDILTVKSVGQKQKNVLNVARDHGLRSGVFMSCHQLNGDMQIISMANSEDREFSPNELAAATLASCALADRMSSNAEPFRDTDAMKLSNRERECLTWVAAGKSSSDIEVIVGISHNTVDFHIKNSMKKLGTSTRMVAVVKALRLGLINP